MRWSYQADGSQERISILYGQEEDIFVFGHPSRISQVLSNILDNAHSLSPKENNIKLTLTTEKTGKNPKRSDENKAVILIDDEGAGIQADNIDRIFERFYTDRSEQSGFGKNSGLGLSISKQIIESHNGSLSAENRVDENNHICGARFKITLPLIESKGKR